MTTIKEHGVPIRQIVYKFPPAFLEQLSTKVLEHRDDLKQGARASLDSAIRDGIRIQGFRDASKADASLLGHHVFHASVGDDRIACSLLRAWMEIEGDLHRIVARHLESAGTAADGPNFKDRRFDETWTVEEWEERVEQLATANPDLDRDAVGMMVCLASGRVPLGDGADLSVSSEVLNEIIDTLGDIEPGEPEWSEIASFVKVVEEIAKEKALRRTEGQKEDLAAALKDAAEFREELAYLEIELDPDAWSEEAAERPDRLEEALSLAERLKGGLSSYRDLRPRAESRQQELERAAERTEAEEAVLEIAEQWDQSIRTPDEPAAEAAADGDGPTEEAEDGPAQQAAAESQALVAQLESDLAGAEERCQALQSEADGLKAQLDSLRSENEDLAGARRSLESHRDQLNAEIGNLRDEIVRLGRQEEQWRQSYIDFRRNEVTEGEGAPDPKSVREAIALAEDSFPDTLEFALNAKSDKNSPFQRPTEVFDALSWLATVYHHHRTNPGKPPQFDRLLKESCPGWSYKPGQTKTTKQRFDEWYFTSVNGRTYTLDAHLGKGNSHDPQNTIRIAFAWDDDADRVVVGYMGLHQRNRQT